MLRALLGIVKGFIVGGAIGYGLLRLGLVDSLWAYLSCAVVGALVGVICGRPPWRSDTIWTPVVKMVVGSAIGTGLCALGLHVLPRIALVTFQGQPLTTQSNALLAAGVGVLYGMFVEIDDGGKSDDEKSGKSLKAPSPKARLKS